MKIRAILVSSPAPQRLSGELFLPYYFNRRDTEKDELKMSREADEGSEGGKEQRCLVPFADFVAIARQSVQSLSKAFGRSRI